MIFMHLKVLRLNMIKKRLKIADGADILPAPSAYKINTNAIGDYEMPLAIVYLFKSIIIESI